MGSICNNFSLLEFADRIKKKLVYNGKLIEFIRIITMISKAIKRWKALINFLRKYDFGTILKYIRFSHFHVCNFI